MMYINQLFNRHDHHFEHIVPSLRPKTRPPADRQWPRRPDFLQLIVPADHVANWPSAESSLYDI